MTDKHSQGDLFTSRDVQDFAEYQDAMDALPWGLQKYYLLKAGYFILRTKKMAIAIAAGIVSLGILAYFTENNLAISLLLILIGVLVGFVIAWEIGKDDAHQ